MQEFFGPLTPALILGAIIGGVEFAKQFGVAGKWASLSALGGGVVLGVLYQLQLGPAFEIGVYGLLLGLAASGFYTMAKKVGGGE